uniref:Uncharacterized protein n=1 Tax=Arundo donax TaxID=35708 RepID=A0A0A8XTY8_ARUDO
MATRSSCAVGAFVSGYCCNPTLIVFQQLHLLPLYSCIYCPSVMTSSTSILGLYLGDS